PRPAHPAPALDPPAHPPARRRGRRRVRPVPQRRGLLPLTSGECHGGAMTFTELETIACSRLAAWALQEDLGAAGGLTSKATIPEDLAGRAVLAARGAGVLAGLPAARLTFHLVVPRVCFPPEKEDGDPTRPGDR